MDILKKQHNIIKIVTNSELDQMIRLAKKINNYFGSRLIDTTFLYDVNNNCKIDHILISLTDYGNFKLVNNNQIEH